ncbi:MAG: UDP-2,3-diacylglucosamine diphosphatase LpxI [Verrucomicrobiota bacterium]|nr:UDP-2,3-diacylglucosamine diphosphatase LpxI [Verrucomicrobiota bacterium]
MITLVPKNVTTFLPNNFDGQPIGLIAGKGLYPKLMADRIREAGVPLRIISFLGETEERLFENIAKDEHIQIKVGQLGKLLKSLLKLNCRYAVMAGQITPKKLFQGLQPDLKALAILNRLKIKNAETIFGAIASEIESLNIHVLDARSFLGDQLADLGRMTTNKQCANEIFIKHGIRIAQGITELDVGQSAVVRKGTVLAVEAFEGTDSMLKRAGTFKTDDLIFIKTVKRDQDYRFDVPVFGERTLDVMNDCNIRTAALEADRVIMLDKDSLIKKANTLQIELLGFRSP